MSPPQRLSYRSVVRSSKSVGAPDANNFNGYDWFDDSGNFYTDTAHIVERLTMIDRDTIHYEVRVEDPKVYTRP